MYKSTDVRSRMSQVEQDPELTDWHQVRETILERDNHRCTNCGRPEQVVKELHIDHAVPKGRGGSERFRNLRTLCKQCHWAKHHDGYGPMLEFQSTGRMDQYTFLYFKQFFNEILPAMGRQVGTRIVPKFRLDDSRDAWFIPLGDIRHADATLATFDEKYSSLRAADYF